MAELPRPSLLDPLARAVDRTTRILFRPFQIEKWFVLGFCAWLAYLGEGGSGGLGNRLRRDDFFEDLDRGVDWIRAHLGLIVVLAFVGLALAILIIWISSRGKLVFLDGVVRDRAAVAEPWARFATLGNSLFGFRLILGLIGIATFVALASLMVRDLLQITGPIGFGDVLALSLWVAVFSPLLIAFMIVGLILEDFVIPIMWLRQVTVMVAWREALAFVSAHLGIFVLYVLLKIVLAIVIGTIACVAVCVTCCVAALPYLGVVLLLPLYVFRRSYSLEFLAQFGADYAALAPLPPAPPTPASPAAGAP